MAIKNLFSRIKNFLSWADKKFFLLPVLSGILLFFGYPPYNFKIFLWAALLPLLFFIESESSRKRVFSAGFLTGLIFFGGILSWLFSAYPADWMNAGNGPIIFFLLILIWLVSVSVLAVFIGFFCCFVKALKASGWANIVLIPSLWIIFEYLRSWGLGILWLGRDSLLGPHWTFGLLGYGLAESSNFLQWAAFAGVYGLSFLIVFINSLIFVIFTIISKGYREWGGFVKKTFLPAVLIILIFVFLNIGGAIIGVNKERNVTDRILNIAILQTEFPSHFNFNQEIINFELNTLLYLFGKAAALSPRPDLIVFPEDSRFLRFLARYRPDFNLAEALKNNSVSIIDSGRSEEPNGETYFQLYYFHSEKGLVKAQKKLFLMPGGEYFPYLARAAVRLAGGREWLNEFEANREYSKGTTLVLGEHEGVKIGTLFCPEIFSPELYRKITDLGAEILINISGHGIFRGSKSLLSQVRAAAKLRAVENNRYLIQAINYNLSSVIDNQGNAAICRISRFAPAGDIAIREN